MASMLRRVVLLQRDVRSATRFYTEGLGLRLKGEGPTAAELEGGNGDLRIALLKVEGEAMLSSGYSPLLAFDVDDLDATVVRLLKMGAALDGPIRYPEHGKVASLRAPDGHMIGLYEGSDKFDTNWQ